MSSKRKPAAHVREYLRGLIAEKSGINRLRVFDFDDTLIVTDAKIWITDEQGNKRSLTPAEFAVYDKIPGEVFDFSEFHHQLINPRAITWMGRIMKSVYDKYGPDGLVILSARGSANPIMEFLDSISMSGIEVRALGDPDPLSKVKWVESWIRDLNLDFIEVFDDSHKNVDAIRALRDKHPNVHIIARHVTHTHLPTHGYAHHGMKQSPKTTRR